LNSQLSISSKFLISSSSVTAEPFVYNSDKLLKKDQLQGATKRLRRRSETYAAQGSDVCNAANGFFQQFS